MPFPEDHFPHDYREARNAFIHACEARDLGITSRLNGAVTGADGKPLFMDTTTIGARDAKKAVLIISATHGGEGYFCSGVQTGLLRDGIEAPKGVRLVMLPALNPFGFSWARRVNEDNADINRTSVDSKTPPKNPAYDELADAIILP